MLSYVFIFQCCAVFFITHYCFVLVGVGAGPSSQWDFGGSTLVTSQYVRLTPDERSKQGSIWNTVVSVFADQLLLILGYLI